MACALLAEVLCGGGQGGTYQYDQKLTLSSKATDGMVGVNIWSAGHCEGQRRRLHGPQAEVHSRFAVPATSPSKVGAALGRHDTVLVERPVIATT